MRIAFDVSPLSHERTGVNNYIRGSLTGLAEAARPLGHEIVAFAPTSPAGKRVIPRGAGRDRRRDETGCAARRALLAHCLVDARLSARRALHRQVRRAPLQRLDVPAAAARRSRDHDPRCRPAPSSPSGRRSARGRCTAASTATPRDLRRRVCELGVHRRRLRRLARLPASSACSSPIPASARTSRPTGQRRPRRAVPPHRRDARAAQEPRTLVALRVLGARTSRSRVVGGRRLGRAAAARPSRRSCGSAASPTRSSHGSIAARRRSSTRRASRASACRSPRRWPAARRSSRPRTSRWTRRRATPRCAPTPRARGDRRGDPRRARATRRAARARARARARIHLARAQARSSWRVRAIRVALDTTPLRQTRAGTARYVRGLLEHVVASTSSRCRYPATSRLRDARARRALVPAASRRRGRRRAPLPDFPWAVSARQPLVVTVHDLAVLRHPEWFNRWTRIYSRVAVPRVVARGGDA